MHRLTTLATQWVLAISMVCVLLAWPLHMAHHAAEPVAGSAARASGEGAETVAKEGIARKGDPEAGSVCAWCLFHGQQHLLDRTPAMLRFHADASPPPAVLVQGLPSRHSALAAKPRGPPRQA